jgi:lipoprotein-anchoring transpeptidase ErfK/SrfK
MSIWKKTVAAFFIAIATAVGALIAAKGTPYLEKLIAALEKTFGASPQAPSGTKPKVEDENWREIEKRNLELRAEIEKLKKIPDEQKLRHAGLQFESIKKCNARMVVVPTQAIRENQILFDMSRDCVLYSLKDGTAIAYPATYELPLPMIFTGPYHVSEKQEWPDWYPSSDLRKRYPYLPTFMAGGPGNPLGARLIKFNDTPFFISGGAPGSLSVPIKNGVRMNNADISDLFDRISASSSLALYEFAEAKK